MLIHRKICEIVKQITQILLHFLHSFRIVQRIEKLEWENRASLVSCNLPLWRSYVMKGNFWDQLTS